VGSLSPEAARPLKTSSVKVRRGLGGYSSRFEGEQHEVSPLGEPQDFDIVRDAVCFQEGARPREGACQ
jgi:hypothetical protein